MHSFGIKQLGMGDNSNPIMLEMEPHATHEMDPSEYDCSEKLQCAFESLGSAEEGVRRARTYRQLSHGALRTAAEVNWRAAEQAAGSSDIRGATVSCTSTRRAVRRVARRTNAQLE
jgi:hypothetical protein